MASKARLVLKGDKALIRKLKRLGDRRKLRKVLRQATNAASQIVVKAVRRKWPTDTGLSRKSVTKKISRGKAGFTAIIGVDRAAVGARRDGKKHVPSNIDHLIELGFQHPGGKTVPAVAPLRRGYEASAAAARTRYAEKARQAIEKEAKKK